VGALRRGTSAVPALLTDGADGSLLVVLPLADASDAANISPRISEELARTTALSHKEEALSQLLGERYAALHLPQSGEQWTIYRTGQGSSLRLCSPQRLPTLWDHPHASAQSKLFVKRAASGDVMVISSAERIPPWDDAAIDLWVGGPGLLASFIDDASPGSGSQSTVVVEVL
jgi:hypothetical protein